MLEELFYWNAQREYGYNNPAGMGGYLWLIDRRTSYGREIE